MTETQELGEQLQVRHVYVIHSRNLLVGVWNGVGFTGIREKFNDTFLATEYLNTVRSIGADVTVVPDEIDLRESLGTECITCSKGVFFQEHNDPSKLGRGEWFHTDGSTEHKVRPVSVHNRALFDFLAFEEWWQIRYVAGHFGVLMPSMIDLLREEMRQTWYEAKKS